MVNIVLYLTIWKKYMYIFCIRPKILISYSLMDHRPYPNDVAFRTVRCSWCLYTVGRSLLFTQSVNSTNITVLSFNVSLFWTRTLCNIFSKVPLQQHFHTQDWRLTNGLVRLKYRPCVDKLSCLYVYSLSWIGISDIVVRYSGVYDYFLSS